MPRPTPEPAQKKGDKNFVSPTKIEEPPLMSAEEAAVRSVFEDDLLGEVETPSDIPDPDSLLGRILNAPPLPFAKGLHAKLAEVIQEVTYIQKTGTAPAAMGGYSFVEAGQIAAVLRMALATRGVTMLPEHIEQVGDVIETTTRNGSKMFIQTIKTTWRLTDSETGETAIIESMGTGGDSSDKFSPKAQTNSMKYALQVGFLLETGDDPEKSDLSEPAQGPGINIGPSDVKGVQQGGRQTKATKVQLDEIRRHAKRVGIGPEAMVAIIGAALGGKAPELDQEDAISDQQQAVIKFLGDLPFDEAGKVVEALSNADTE